MKKRLYLLLILGALVLGIGISQLEQGYHSQGKQQLEELLRRTAVACYASQGFYPPDVEYMCREFGLTYDETRFVIRYTFIAENLMPEITVLEAAP